MEALLSLSKCIIFNGFTGGRDEKRGTKLAKLRLPYSKIISGMTNIITAVMLNHFSTPRTVLLK